MIITKEHWMGWKFVQLPLLRNSFDHILCKDDMQNSEAFHILKSLSFYQVYFFQKNGKGSNSTAGKDSKAGNDTGQKCSGLF